MGFCAKIEKGLHVSRKAIQIKALETTTSLKVLWPSFKASNGLAVKSAVL
jgi:hypothetical protein